MALTEEQLGTWVGRVALAKHYQKQVGNQHDRWEKYVKGLAGDFQSKGELGDEAIDVNMIFPITKTILPPLWLNEPHIAFRPTRSRVTVGGKDVDNIRRAEINEAEVNYWMKELRVREQVVRPAVYDAETTNHGYAYVGYIKDKAEVEIDGESTEPNPNVKLKQPFVIRVSPRQVLLPPGKWFLEDCEWVCLLWLKPLKDVSDKYGIPEEDLKITKRIAPGISEKHMDAPLKEYLEGQDAQLVEVQQIFDKRTKQIITLADGLDRELNTEEWKVTTEGFPLVDLHFVDIPDEYYGTPEIQYYYPQQKEKNAARTSMRKRFNRSKATVITRGDVGSEFKQQYAKSQDGEVLTLSSLGEGEDIRSALYVDQGLPPDMQGLHYDSAISRDILEISGASAEQRGAADPNIDTATQSANVEKHVQVRSSDKGDRVRTFYLDVARKLRMVLLQFPSVKRSRMIAGPVAGQFAELEYTLRELEGEFALELDLSGQLVESPQTRQAQALANYNLLRVDPLVAPERLILDLLQSQNKPNPEQYLLRLRAPEDEFELMVQGLPVEPHERDNHEVHLQDHDAQASQLEQMLERIDPDSNAGQKARFTLALLLSHVNATMRIVQQIVPRGGRQPGQPVSENLFRNQQTQVAGNETAAELTGQPLSTPSGGGL